jgi:hypothetical protein
VYPLPSVLHVVATFALHAGWPGWHTVAVHRPVTELQYWPLAHGVLDT